MARKFNFTGTNSKKFQIAGANYISKVFRLNRDKATLLQYAEVNYTQVCNDGVSKGFCYGQCKNCPVQKAYEATLKALAMREDSAGIIVINNYGTINVCAKKRYGISWEEFKKSQET